MTVYYEVRDAVAVLQLDSAPVNGLGHAVRCAFLEHLQRAAQDRTVRAIVVTGTDRMFSGGADIREFNTPAAAASPTLRELIDAVEGCSKPVIAAINGACMGGGLELSLACHYRLATRDATLGLPEVRIGILPGAGGTQRLPRAVGVEQALKMIVSGDAVAADEALATGLVDWVVPKDGFQPVVDRAHDVARRSTLPRLRDRPAALPADATAADWFAAARERVLRDTRGLVAAQRCVDAVEAAVMLPFDEGLALERRLFLELVASPESRALRHAFFAERTAARIDGIDARVEPRPVRTAAVIGFGTMGGGIAMTFANAGIPVQVLEKRPEAIERGLATCRRNWVASANKGKLTMEQVEQRMALLRPAQKFEEIGAADIVVEAVYEDMAVKREVFRALDRVMKKGAVIATNTSTLDVDAIAGATSRPADVVGTHFFSPANVMRLLEVVRGRQTGADVLASVMALAKRIRKVAVVSGVCDGFIGNRMLEQYVRQALFLVDEGASPERIDGALTRFGLAMGPFAMYDMAGGDIGYAIRQRRYVEKPELRYSRIADLVVERGRLGQKTGKGWYRYEPGSRAPLPDPEVDALIAAHRASLGIAPREIGDDEIVERCLYALVTEGARILEEGIAQRASDIDVVYLAGYGFPAVRGGPMYHAQSVGLAQVVSAIERFAANTHADPAFWQAPALLRAAARDGAWPR